MILDTEENIVMTEGSIMNQSGQGFVEKAKPETGSGWNQKRGKKSENRKGPEEEKKAQSREAASKRPVKSGNTNKGRNLGKYVKTEESPDASDDDEDGDSSSDY